LRKRAARENKSGQPIERIRLATEERDTRAGQDCPGQSKRGDTGVLHGSENKGVARKAICKSMKIKAFQIDQACRGICKLLILKGRRNSP
jgi:hypothetical protein